MEGKFCDGRTDAFRDSAQGRGKHGLVVPRVWNFTQDRIQDPGSLRAVRGGGLSDRTRRPHRYANQLPAPIEATIVAAKREKPYWGARKIHERLLRRLPSEVKVPARSTIHAVLDRHGLVARASRTRTRAEG